MCGNAQRNVQYCTLAWRIQFYAPVIFVHLDAWSEELRKES